MKQPYDGNGNQLEKVQKHGTIKYNYDRMNRLEKVQYPNATEELFYDKAGNRTKRLYNGIEELYQYDKRNRLTTYTKGGVTSQFTYDKAGNLLKDDKAKYTYDAFNRNTKVETFNGNIQINRYDAEDLRHEMEENGKLVTFIFRGDEIVTEETQEDKIRYIRTNSLLASDAESARTYYHYASDEMGSITHVVDSEANKILNQYEYDAWGNLTTCNEKVPNRFKFNGQQYDPITQQYYLRARYYNPVIGRFTQEDTYRGDGLNLYAYCAGNPVYYVDPSGHIICEKIANILIDKVKNNKATRNEQKKLVAYLTKKSKKYTLEDNEEEILERISGYTYLNRYENQTFFKCPPKDCYQDSAGNWRNSKGYVKHRIVGLRSCLNQHCKKKNNQWTYRKEYHDKMMEKIFGTRQRGNVYTDKDKPKRYRRDYDLNYNGYDLEFKSSNFSKAPRTDDELSHMTQQAEKDIYYKKIGKANPYWHFLHNPKEDPKMIPILKMLEDAKIEWSYGEENPFI